APAPFDAAGADVAGSAGCACAFGASGLVSTSASRAKRSTTSIVRGMRGTLCSIVRRTLSISRSMPLSRRRSPSCRLRRAGGAAAGPAAGGSFPPKTITATIAQITISVKLRLSMNPSIEAQSLAPLHPRDAAQHLLAHRRAVEVRAPSVAGQDPGELAARE